MKTDWQISLRSFLLICAGATILLILLWPNPMGLADGGGTQSVTVDGGVLPISKLTVVPVRANEDMAAISTALKSNDSIGIFSLVEPERITTIPNPSVSSVVNVEQSWSFSFRDSIEKRTNYQQTYSHVIVVAIYPNGDHTIRSIALPDYCKPATVNMSLESR